MWLADGGSSHAQNANRVGHGPVNQAVLLDTSGGGDRGFLAREFERQGGRRCEPSRRESGKRSRSSVGRRQEIDGLEREPLAVCVI
jgi:hypothetical protein